MSLPVSRKKQPLLRASAVSTMRATSRSALQRLDFLLEDLKVDPLRSGKTPCSLMLGLYWDNGNYHSGLHIYIYIGGCIYRVI